MIAVILSYGRRFRKRIQERARIRSPQQARHSVNSKVRRAAGIQSLALPEVVVGDVVTELETGPRRRSHAGRK